MALPVALSQTTVVSRWLVMPMAAIGRVAPALFDASRQVATVVDQKVLGVMLDPAGIGKCWVNSCWPVATIGACGSNRIARLEVVPWSMARIWVMGPPEWVRRRRGRRYRH